MGQLSYTWAGSAGVLEPVDNGASDLVQQVIAETGDLASIAHTQALAAITALGAFSPNIPTIAVPDIPVQGVSPLPLGTEPAAPGDLSASFPPAPLEPTVGDLTDVTLGDEPVFDVSTPTLVEVPLPDPFDALMPAAPELAAPDVPVEPDYVVPPVPTMAGLNLPDVPTLDLPLFNETLRDSPAEPSAEFSWAENDYNTALLTQMNTRLVTLINGAHTGLDADVEAAIWNRGRDRAALVTQRGVDEATRMLASRGFSMPQGTLVRVVQQAVAEGQRMDADLSRDILIKQAELEQSNFQFSFNMAMQLEGALINHFNQVQNRALDAAKFEVASLIDIFNAKVTLFNADVQAFGMKASVFKTRLEAALAQLEVYKQQLEGQKLVGQLNEQAARIYESQLKGVQVIAEIYKSRIEGVKVRIDADRARVDIFKAQIDGYDSQVKAKTAEYQGYAERVKAELTKVQMFGEQVQAFKSRSDAYAALVNARLGAATLDFKQNQEFPVDLYKSRIQAYSVNVQAEAERLRAVAQIYESRVRAFAASEQAKATHTSAEVEAVKATSAVYTSQAQLALQAGESNMKLAMTAHETAQANLRAAGQLSGQLAAAALAARNVSASISANTSNSVSNASSTTSSNSTVSSDSFSESHIYNED